MGRIKESKMLNDEDLSADTHTSICDGCGITMWSDARLQNKQVEDLFYNNLKSGNHSSFIGVYKTWRDVRFPSSEMMNQLLTIQQLIKRAKEDRISGTHGLSYGRGEPTKKGGVLNPRHTHEASKPKLPGEDEVVLPSMRSTREPLMETIGRELHVDIAGMYPSNMTLLNVVNEPTHTQKPIKEKPMNETTSALKTALIAISEDSVEYKKDATETLTAFGKMIKSAKEQEQSNAMAVLEEKILTARETVSRRHSRVLEHYRHMKSALDEELARLKALTELKDNENPSVKEVIELLVTGDQMSPGEATELLELIGDLDEPKSKPKRKPRAKKAAVADKPAKS